MTHAPKATCSNGMSRRRVLKAACVGIGALSLPSTGCIGINTGSHAQLVWGRRGWSEGRFIKPRAITIDSSDQLYIVDTTGRIQVFDSDGQHLRHWNIPQTKNGRPTGLAVERLAGTTTSDDEHLLVADTHYYRMLVYTLEGDLVEDAQIGGTAGFGPGQFAFVTDAACDDQGCFYIGEYGDSDRIQKFDPDGQFMTQFGGTGREPEQFMRPQGLVVGGDVLWIADAGNHRIQRYDIRSETPKLIDIWGREGKGLGEFWYPYGMSLASDGSLVICEYGNQRLQRFSPTGELLASWGSPGFDVGQLHEPWGVVVDSQDRVHVLDSNNHRVQRLQLPS